MLAFGCLEIIDPTFPVQRFLDAANVTGAEILVERPVNIATGAITSEFTRVTVTLPYSPITTSLLFKTTINIKGDSYRLKEKRRAGLLRSVATTRPSASLMKLPAEILRSP